MPSLSQVHSGKLQAVLDIVLSHQGAALKCALLQRLMSALVLPAPEHYRSLLRRLAALAGGWGVPWCCWQLGAPLEPSAAGGSPQRIWLGLAKCIKLQQPHPASHPASLPPRLPPPDRPPSRRRRRRAQQR